LRTWTGVLFVVISAAGFSTLGILGRYAYADGLDPLTILFLRFTMSTAIMAVILGLRREGLPRGRVLLQLVGMGAVGYRM
jgi:drug/metabolite transporter (DMT)-like permease